jgi:hypothetical protein
MTNRNRVPSKIGNRAAVPAGLFRMSVDKGRRLPGRILRLSTLAGLCSSAS